MLALACLSGCDSAPPVTPVSPAATNVPAATASLAIATSTAAPLVSTVAPPAPTPAPTLGPTPLFRTPTPPANPGTVISEDGAFKVLSHPYFFWTLKLPREWLITYDRGFELFANNPQQTAFMRLFSEVWSTRQKWLPNARAYVDYWKNFPGGSLFPVYAHGAQIAESDMSPDKLGGPYLRYEFDDAKRGLRYVQVYASGGGPNSLVLTAWTKAADRASTQVGVDGILTSLALLKLP